METRSFRKFCPVCKLGNDVDALICQHCGARFDDGADAPTTRQFDEPFELTEEIRDQVTKEHTPPSKGVSLFFLNKSEPIVDLTQFEGFAMGVSRRHAMLRAAGEKYALIDLNSSNGTWLNGQRLVPNKAYDLPSGSVIQLGRMKLIVSYVHPPQKTRSSDP